jgi:hypothetical protein
MYMLPYILVSLLRKTDCTKQVVKSKKKKKKLFKKKLYINDVIEGIDGI